MKYVLLLFLSVCNIANSIDFHSPQKNLTTSIIIPCHYKHAIWLPSLLDAFAEQTVLPDEIVISLSECKQVSAEIIHDLTSNRWPFPVKLLQYEESLSAGGNRKRACSHASCALFICQDADDLPHPQRIEILRYFFEFYDFDHIMYYFTSDVALFKHFPDLSQVKWIWRDTAHGANGPIAIPRRVFDAIHWTEDFIIGEDVFFNYDVYERFPNRITILEYIYLYREDFSLTPKLLLSPSA